MQKNAENSQQKTSNLGSAYAYKIARTNPDYITLKVWILRTEVFVATIEIKQLDELISQIDEALSNGDLQVCLNGNSFRAPENLLKEIRAELAKFSSYAQGGSDAQVVLSGASAPAKPKASARRRKRASCERQFIKPRVLSPESEVEKEKLAHSAEGLAKIIGTEIRSAIAPLIVDLDATAALLNECLEKISSEDEPEAKIRTKNGRTSVIVARRIVK